MSEANYRVPPLVIGGRTLRSRLFLGTGRFPNPAVMIQALEASGAQVVTFAVRRVNLDETADDSVLQHLEGRDLIYLPNTSGASNAAEAVRIARLARAAGLGDWVKVEISADPRTLLPDPVETLKATAMLADEGFTVLPYTSDDPVLCRRLAEAGAAAVMPGGSPIGTGLGILNPYNLRLIADEARVPVIVDAGLGSAADAAQAMELGASGILVNTPVAKALDPVAMARAMALAVEAGALSRAAGRIPRRLYATASSDPDGVLEPLADRAPGPERDMRRHVPGPATGREPAGAGPGATIGREPTVFLSGADSPSGREPADAGPRDVPASGCEPAADGCGAGAESGSRQAERSGEPGTFVPRVTGG